jgi:hypothetical protein
VLIFNHSQTILDNGFSIMAKSSNIDALKLLHEFMGEVNKLRDLNN